MITAAMIWNEPNNLSHWDFEIDQGWTIFGRLVGAASQAIEAEHPRLDRVLGGISPIDPAFIRTLDEQGALARVTAVAVHGFPLDWNHWQIGEWPCKLREVQTVTALPVWVSEAGASSFGAEEVQEFGLRRTTSLLAGLTPRLYWYSLLDLPRAWPATTRHREAEGSAYYRHFYMGLIREDGTPKPAFARFAECTPDVGLCQWFHFNDPRLDDAVRWMRELGVTRVRTGLSWSESCLPGAEAWFDRLMSSLDQFDVTVTFCFTPDHMGIRPHHTSPPHDVQAFADFCGRMIRRYARG
jgi:beta-xylosidase